MKKLIFPLVSLFILFPTMIVLMGLLLTGKVSISYNGFDVDKYNNVYVGIGENIEVYDENGEFLRNIHVIAGENGKGYSFCIYNGNRILLESVGYDVMNLDGVLLRSIDYSNVETPPLFSFIYDRKEIKTPDGSVYKMIKPFDGRKIVRIKDNTVTVVYSTPAADNIAAIAFGVCMIWASAVAVYCVIYGREMVGLDSGKKKTAAKAQEQDE